MKIFNIFFFVILVCPINLIKIYGQNKSNTIFRIHGHFTGKKIRTILLSFIDIKGNSVTIKSTVINNQFYFSGEIKEPEIAWIRGDIASNWVRDSNSAQIFIEPTDIKVDVKENNFKSLKLLGSKSQKQYDSLENNKSSIYKQMNPYIHRLDSLNHVMDVYLKKKDTSEADKIVEIRKKIVFNEMKPYYDTLKRIDLIFISTHPNSYISPYLLNIHFPSSLPKDSAKIYFNKLNSTIQRSFWGQEIKGKLYKIERIPIGSIFPDMSGTLLDKQKVSIKGLLNNKFTLIIFWASWCPPCRSLSSFYKKMFRDYHNKGLNVVAITQDTKQSEWEDAIKHDSTTALTHFYPDKKYDISRVFDLNSIPAEILLKGNRVIAKYAGADNGRSDVKDLENKLNKIFRKE